MKDQDIGNTKHLLKYLLASCCH